MLDAVKLFEPERGTKFLTVLSWTLKKRFAEENGIRGTRRDALQFSGSMDEPRDNSEKEAALVEVEDEGAALAFMGVEYADFLTYCRGVPPLFRRRQAAASKTTIPALRFEEQRKGRE